MQMIAAFSYRQVRQLTNSHHLAPLLVEALRVWTAFSPPSQPIFQSLGSHLPQKAGTSRSRTVR